MNKNFTSPVEFERYMKSSMKFTKEAEKVAVTGGLTDMCVFLTAKVKEKFGVYPDGPVKWQQLSDTTQDEREKKGYTRNDPLLRDGQLRDSVSFAVVGNSAAVGSDSEIMVYQELGTSRTGWSEKGIPPRPVFLPTQILDGKEAVSIFFQSYIKALRG